MSNPLTDDPMTFINTIAENIFGGLSGGEPYVVGLLAFGLLAYIALHFRLDRGAIVLLSLGFLGAMYAMEIIPPTLFFVVIIIVAVVTAFGVLNAMKQGDG